MTAVPDLPIPADLAYDEPPLTDDEIESDAAAFASPDGLDSTDPPGRRWQVEDDGGAEWCARKLAAIRAEMDTHREQAQEWTEKITAWCDRTLRPLADREAFFVHHLIDYAQRQRAEHDRKTVALPSGKVASRESRATVVVADEAVVVAWAKANLSGDELASVVKVVESVQIAGLRAVVWVKGDVVGFGDEPVPGVEVRPASISFTVAVQ